MEHPITVDRLFKIASETTTEAFFCEFSRALQILCDEEQDRICIFRTLHYTRIRLHALRKSFQAEDTVTCDRQAGILDIAIGYPDTELELLNRYRKVFDRASASLDEQPYQSDRVDLRIAGIALYRRRRNCH